MPPLVLFGRKWQFASDDFVFPTFFDFLIRLVRLTIAYVWLWKNEFKFSCSGLVYSTVYYVGFCGMLQLILIANLALMYNSGLGGIMDSKARRRVPLCLSIRLFLQALEIVWTALGTLWLAQRLYECESHRESAGPIAGTIFLNWILISLFILFFTINLAIGSNASENSNPWMDDFPEDTQTSKSWERIWKLLCCSLQSRNQLVKSGFREIAQIFSYLLDNCGLVSSDIVVGLALISAKQKLERTRSLKAASGENLDQSNFTMHNDESQNWNSFARTKRFFQYATCIHSFTAMYFQKKSPWNVIKSQIKYCTNCLRCTENAFILKGDCCCYCQTGTLTSYLESNLSDNQTVLVHVSFVNEYFNVPFMVAIDHFTKSIVISVRGSMSIKDMFTNGVACSVSIGDWIPGIPRHFQCHGGILHSSILLKRELDQLRLISQLMETFPTYNLITTGNSLGAGVAILLAMMYKQKYPMVKCFAFAVPACLSFDAGEYCNDFVQSVIYGHDMVARLSVRSAKNLLYDITSLLSKCDTPKYRIQFEMLLKAIRLKKYISVDFQEAAILDILPENSNRVVSAYSARINISEVDGKLFPNPNEYTYGSSFKYTLPQIESFCHTEKRSQLGPLYPPGRILHITPTKLFSEGHGRLSCSSGPRWNIRVANRTEFDKIIVRSRMFFDHQPSRTSKALSYFEDLESAKVKQCLS